MSQPLVLPSHPGQQQGTNTMAILSLVFAFVFLPLGIVFGHLGRKQIRATGQGGAGLALAGLIVSYAGLAFSVLMIALIIVGSLAGDPGTY